MAKTKTRERESEKDKPARPVVRSDAYVMMLFITLVAIAVGCVLMYLDYDKYGGKPTPGVAPGVPKLGEGEAKGPAT